MAPEQKLDYLLYVWLVYIPKYCAWSLTGIHTLGFQSSRNLLHFCKDYWYFESVSLSLFLIINLGKASNWTYSMKGELCICQQRISSVYYFRITFYSSHAKGLHAQRGFKHKRVTHTGVTCTKGLHALKGLHTQRVTCTKRLSALMFVSCE